MNILKRAKVKRPTHLKNTQQEQRIFRTRVWVAGGFIMVCFSLLLARYAFLQVVQYEHFRTESDKNRIKLQAIAPSRGYIYDRNGILLADNHPVFTAVVSGEESDNIEPLLPKLTTLLHLTPDDIEKYQGRIKRATDMDQVALKFDLTESEIAQFSERKYEFPGVTIQTKMTRFYPHGELFAHVIGYVGRINEKEMEHLDKVAYTGTDLIGKIGIERFYEDLLHGKPGYQYVEADAHGEVLNRLGSTPAVRGNDLYLSIDYGLQKVAHDQLSGRRGAVVALDPRTGEVLAFVSNPSFDPNPFVAGIRGELYSKLRDDPDQPLFNRALQGLYPPGSTIKPIEGMGGIHFGLIDWGSRIYDGGSFHLPGDSHLFRDDAKGGHGVVDLMKAVAVSCDTFFYVLSYRLGIDRMHEWMSEFGFGQATGIDLPGEKSGLYPSPAWKMAKRKAPWLPGETISLGIGQGYFLASPLQIASAISIIANQGSHVKPHLLLQSRGPVPHPILNRPDYKIKFNGKPEDWLNIREAMVGVVTHGTARRIGMGLKDYRIAGKTGTAQVKSIAQGKRYNEALLNSRQYDHALFTAFAPADNPELAVAIIVENGKSGAGAAAPIARALFDYQVHQRFKQPIKPDPAAMLAAAEASAAAENDRRAVTAAKAAPINTATLTSPLPVVPLNRKSAVGEE